MYCSPLEVSHCSYFAKLPSCHVSLASPVPPILAVRFQNPIDQAISLVRMSVPGAFSYYAKKPPPPRLWMNPKTAAQGGASATLKAPECSLSPHPPHSVPCLHLLFGPEVIEHVLNFQLPVFLQ